MRNDQRGEGDRGVQYGLHTVTGLCVRLEGDDCATKTCLCPCTPRDWERVIVGDAERKKERKGREEEGGGAEEGTLPSARFIWPSWDRAGRSGMFSGERMLTATPQRAGAETETETAQRRMTPRSRDCPRRWTASTGRMGCFFLTRAEGDGLERGWMDSTAAT